MKQPSAQLPLGFDAPAVSPEEAEQEGRANARAHGVVGAGPACYSWQDEPEHARAYQHGWEAEMQRIEAVSRDDWAALEAYIGGGR